jgi:UDP-2,3-diacylglucosamine hydrolase
MYPNDESRRRETDFVRWLDAIQDDAQAIFLLGDIFDFWFEYRYVVPRGFVRLLGKLSELSDSGISIYYFTGNHDLWMRDYLQNEIGLTVYRRPQEMEMNGKSFLIGHGHYLGPVDLIQKIFDIAFNSKFLRVLFAALHPHWGILVGKKWSENGRARHGLCEPFTSIDKEEIAVFAKEQLMKKHFDFFVFGHRHLAMDVTLRENSRYINTGEWVKTYSYAVFDGNDITLHSFKGQTRFLKF